MFQDTSKVVHPVTYEIAPNAEFSLPAALENKAPYFIDLLPVVPVDHPEAATVLTYNRSGVTPFGNGFPLTTNSAPLQLNAANWKQFRAKNYGSTPLYLYVEVSSKKY